MKLQYNILWLDNDLKEYITNGDVNSINDFLIDLGFEPNIIPVFDESDINTHLNIDYDLIISDFNLNKETGDVIIYKLREEKRLDTEILFYSAKTNFIQDPEVKERLAFMERINIHIGRDNLLHKIEKVIQLTVKKLFELNATRGLITAATSDLDVEIQDIVMQLIDKKKIEESELYQFIENKVISPMQEKLEKFGERYEGFHKYFHKIDAVKKWEIFRDLLKPHNSIKEIKDFLSINKTYQSEVIGIRNKFAHAKAEVIGGQLVLRGQFDKDSFTFNEDACIQIRREIIKHKKSIEQFKKQLEGIEF